MRAAVVLFQFLLSVGRGMALMVMDESSCVEVEEEECGYCHTIFMEKCQMKMIEEMVPMKTLVCKNITRSKKVFT